MITPRSWNLSGGLLILAVLVGGCGPGPAKDKADPAESDSSRPVPATPEERAHERWRAEALRRQRSPEWRRMRVFHRLVSKGDRAGTEFVLDSGTPVDARDVNGDSALIIAARNGDPLMLDLLLERGADPDGQNRYGTTALMAASQEGYPRLVLRLLEAGAWVNTVDDRNRNALELATSGGHVATVWLLLRAGADIEGVSSRSALRQAERSGNGRILRMIREAIAARRSR
jgi:hypothetical protein